MTKNEIQPSEVVFDAKKRDFKILNQVLNQHENLTALSNRRLNRQTLPSYTNSFRVEWSIDRVTIVGVLREFNVNRVFSSDMFFEELFEFHGEKITLAQVMPRLAMFGAVEETTSGWNLLDRYKENIAFIQILPFKDEDGREKGRIDFNPNKIGLFLQGTLQDFILEVFDNPHFSRADVACDIINAPNDYVDQYRVADPVSFRPYFGKDGKLETAYWGARSSERQIRLYNKYLEQNKKKNIVPDDVKTWWRLELQLRRSRADEWVKIVHNTLDSFYSLNHFPDDMKATDKVMLAGLVAEHQLISELSERTRRKYRKMMKELAKEDELTQHLKASFSESVDKLNKELNNWLFGMRVDPEATAL